ncbi:uncharacterized protein L203_103621 [Cryptococcus depauperatus CBS 7841]|uniref:Type 1 phosphatases regulator n=1 Tax=Cryptococcus depauperatus CBS 7841 TaxID=1295531 RepID=A0A1E3IIB1_9TREE|nr:hypothetical protein L203_02780 [Cryptococcus depauperatus CBS 7841]
MPTGQPQGIGSSQASIVIEAGPSTQQQDGRPVTTLRLRGGPVTDRRVVWSEETIDNEGMGKKKSKVCCIYHKPRAFDESSEESSSDKSGSERDALNHRRSNGHKAHRLRDGAVTVEEENSESEGGAGDGRARPPKKSRQHRHNHKCDHLRPSTKPNKYDVAPNESVKGKEKNSTP